MKNTKNNTYTVNIAIAAYNAEKNIARMITSLISQEIKDFELNNIIINSDAGTDNTVKIARSFKYPKLKILDSRKRQGFAKVLINLFSKNEADILVLLNDDIIIKDNYFIQKLVKKFTDTKKIGLVCANIQPLKTNNFISTAVMSGFKAYKNLGEYMNHGDNVYTCDGKVLAVSKPFLKSINIPLNLTEMGNVDRFLYFLCIKNGFRYKYSSDAIIYFKFPSTIKDFTRWQIRNYKNSNNLYNFTFKELARTEYKYPVHVFYYFKLIEFIKHPVHSVFILFVGIYCSLMAKYYQHKFNIMWDVIQTTKDL